jgi:hypothetical protein
MMKPERSNRVTVLEVCYRTSSLWPIGSLGSWQTMTNACIPANLFVYRISPPNGQRYNNVRAATRRHAMAAAQNQEEGRN